SIGVSSVAQEKLRPHLGNESTLSTGEAACLLPPRDTLAGPRAGGRCERRGVKIGLLCSPARSWRVQIFCLATDQTRIEHGQARIEGRRRTIGSLARANGG